MGYVQTRDGRIEKHPDQRVQHAIELVFAKFTEVGSVRQTLLWFRQEQVSLPAVDRDPTWGERVTWRLPVYNTVLKFLTNPFYAGAYAFGRTETRTAVVDGQPHKTRGHRRPREAWIALLRDHHDAYIPWETHERIRALVGHNAQMKGLMVRGAVRRGPSLLPGLLRCGQCGRRLHVSYSGTKGYVPRYSCRGAALNHGTAWCLAFGGLRVDEAIEREILRVLRPGAIEAALATSTATTDESGGPAPGRRPGAPGGAVRGGAGPAPVRCRRARASAGRGDAGAALEHGARPGPGPRRTAGCPGRDRGGDHPARPRTAPPARRGLPARVDRGGDRHPAEETDRAAASSKRSSCPRSTARRRSSS